MPVSNFSHHVSTAAVLTVLSPHKLRLLIHGTCALGLQKVGCTVVRLQ